MQKLVYILLFLLAGCPEPLNPTEEYPWPILVMGDLHLTGQGYPLVSGPEAIVSASVEVRKDAPMPLSMFSIRVDLFKEGWKMFREGDRVGHLTMYWYGNWSPGEQETRVINPQGFSTPDTMVARWSSIAYSDDTSRKCNPDSRVCYTKATCLPSVIWCEIPDAYHRDPEYRDP
jgi:hypothetical protein